MLQTRCKFTDFCLQPCPGPSPVRAPRCHQRCSQAPRSPLPRNPIPWHGGTRGGQEAALGGLSVHWPIRPRSVSSVAELRASRQVPGENHKSRGYTRALSRAVFDRDTKFNFLRRALNPQPSLRGSCGRRRHPHPTLPRGPQHPAPWHGCKGRGVLLGTSRCPQRPLCPHKLAAAAPSRHHLPGSRFLKGDGFGARGNAAQRKPQSWNHSS